MSSKKYRIQSSCPQCGCSAIAHLSAEEIKERFGDAPNAHLECAECLLKYETPVAEACPEWDKECRMTS